MNPITLTLPQQQRSGAPLTLGPATLPAGYSEARLTINMPQADYENVANHFDLVIEYSRDNGNTWAPMGSAHWDGGPLTVKGIVDPPLVLVIGGLANYAGFLVHATMDTAQTMTWGATLTLT